MCCSCQVEQNILLSNEHGLNPHGAIEAQAEKCDHHKEIALI